MVGGAIVDRSIGSNPRQIAGHVTVVMRGMSPVIDAIIDRLGQDHDVMHCFV